MAEPPAGTQTQNDDGVLVPDDIRQKHPDLVELILHSESMNDEERQYWINILPVMTEDQVENLRTILVNEKKQLAAIDQKYSKQIEKMGQEELVRRTGARRNELRSKRESVEQTHEREDEEKAKELLEEIERA